MSPFRVIASSAALSLALFLTACASDSRVLFETIKLALSGSSSDITINQYLNPSYRYLRLTVENRFALLVLGFIETEPKTGEVVEIWYSGQQEVLRIKNGRIVGTAGMPVDWQAVRYKRLPSWSYQLLEEHGSLEFERERDLPTTYTFGYREKVTLKPLEIESSKRLVKSQEIFLAGVPKSDLVWFEEVYSSVSGSVQNIPSSIFAIDKKSQVVYSKQCLSKALCLHLQPWNEADQAAHQLSRRKSSESPYKATGVSQ
jgi:hypothetical protein